jgi:DNA-binding NarL/FixJ family response regulator
MPLLAAGCLPSPSSALASPLRVLLVDDHPMFLDGLRNLLAAHGMEVVGLGQDGLEAQTLARALRPDLIVMDLQGSLGFPVIGGLESPTCWGEPPNTPNKSGTPTRSPRKLPETHLQMPN